MYHTEGVVRSHSTGVLNLRASCAACQSRKEPWSGRAVNHFILDTELSTSPGWDTHKSLISAITVYSANKDQ